MKAKVTYLLLSEIDPAPAFAVRARHDPGTVRRFADNYRRESDVPPVAVFAGGGKSYLGDGGYRFRACRHNRAKKVACVVEHLATAADAERAAYACALGANRHHDAARCRTAADVRAAVRTALARPEYAGWSNVRIAKVVRCSPTTVNMVRREMDAAGALPSGSTIVDRVRQTGGLCRPKAKLRSGPTRRAADPARKALSSLLSLVPVNADPAAFPAGVPVLIPPDLLARIRKLVA